jgi:hypothetical protein
MFITSVNGWLSIYEVEGRGWVWELRDNFAAVIARAPAYFETCESCTDHAAESGALPGTGRPEAIDMLQILYGLESDPRS